ncbi:insecticidal delta-endotoxin Cry8Ea1 family protein, partial [Bacillus thuringiensis]|uniref:insecticidal delta-endotoxin Cry8Ea1 family protein n=1 Tax=Bacillus thuringiensis TaxID=1428 RepID=UPI002AB429EE
SSNDFNQSNRYPRYPLAKESNYKDWLANGKESNLDTLSTPSSVQDAIVTTLNISSYILSFLSSGFIGTGLGILGVLFGQFWPSDNRQVWETLLRSVEELIDREIRDVERRRLLSQFDGLKSVMSNYNGALSDWNANPTNQDLKREVTSRFDNADDAFANRMPEFRISGFEVESLAIYAQAANLHLLLLRDAVVNGSAWGFNTATIERLYAKLVCLSGAYADHCTTFYRQGLQELRNRGNWNNFNNYRRNMTINVLDTITLFSNYDPRMYSLHTNTQLTREVYTEPAVTPVWLNYNFNTTDFQRVENDLIGSPSLSSNLHSLEASASSFDGASDPVRVISRTRMSRSNIGGTVFTTPWRGVSNPIVREELQRNFSNTNVFEIRSLISRVVLLSRAFGTSVVEFFGGPYINLGYLRDAMEIRSSIPRTASGNQTHRLYSIKSTAVGTQLTTSNCIAYGWAHNSLERTNSILPNRITQIPFVKANFIESGTHVRSGPDHTGGSLVSMGGDAQFGMVVTSSTRQRYRVRLRYAASNSVDFRLRISPFGVDYNFTLPGGGTSFNPDLRYSSFQYITLPIEFETPNSQLNFNFTLDTRTLMNGTCFFDRVEFLPVNATALEYEGKQNLVKAKKAVDDLFTNTGKEALKIDTTDYDVDQAANLVECVSEELYTKEKMILLDEVKHAKQLSASRNLIQNGNFAFYTDEWTTSNNVSIQADNPIFKGNYLKMPGASETEGGTTRFPTYVLQKIDESKLKPYTRYKFRGFVGSSHDVKLIVERYGKEVDALLNVRNDLALNTVAPSRIEANQCQSQPYPIIQDGCLTNVIDTNSYEEAQSGHANFKKEHGMCHQSHQFDFHIDTGEVHINKNPGIWVLFKISSPEGHATLDNIELIEDGPLVGESLALVKKREKEWKHEMETRWLQTKEVYEKAKGEIDTLFTDAQDHALKFDTNLSHIISAEHLVQSMPYVYNKWLSDVPGMNYDIYTELERRITQAYSLYERRNIIKNGYFDHDLNHWHATPHAKVQQIDGTAVLVLPNWSSNVSQNLCVGHNHGYVLRVTAKKEGHGKGYVTISDCNGNQETLTFTSSDNYVSNEITNDQLEYPFSQEMNEQRSYNPNETINEQLGYRLGQVSNEQRCYTRNEITNDQSECHFIQEMNEQRSYNPNETINEQRNYVTRTIDFFPDTNQVRIDIGETEGTFKVESIELICRKSQ